MNVHMIKFAVLLITLAFAGNVYADSETEAIAAFKKTMKVENPAGEPTLSLLQKQCGFTGCFSSYLVTQEIKDFNPQVVGAIVQEILIKSTSEPVRGLSVTPISIGDLFRGVGLPYNDPLENLKKNLK
jgi:hypothetical protein